MSANAISQKVSAAGSRRASARLLDLFAGSGGLSLDFYTSGFELRAAIEFETDAARSYGLNFHGGAPEHSRARDITVTHPEDLADELELGPIGTAVDVIVGGPPCQAFARVGRSKLREIDEHPEAFKHDPRARLNLEYLRYVDAFLAVLMENVPDVLNHGVRTSPKKPARSSRTRGMCAATPCWTRLTMVCRRCASGCFSSATAA